MDRIASTATTEALSDWQRDFIRFAIDQQVLSFGDFTLKSGRQSPYFFNAGRFQTGEALDRLGRYYAQALVDSAVDFDLVFGPAYKGIPLATTTVVALNRDHGRSVPYAFNRKEAKDHGEGGTLVGAELMWWSPWIARKKHPALSYRPSKHCKLNISYQSFR